MAGRYVDKELCRRRNRKKKLRKLRIRLQETHSSEERERLLDKMRRISLYPNDIPELSKR
ncbi:MAG TPA: DUF6800 family protein [Anaerolineales bacterium]|nr:DUF6800 family protein [Anaerolineales bacterium]